MLILTTPVTMNDQVVKEKERKGKDAGKGLESQRRADHSK